MSDYASSLPVRTETPGDVIIKVADATVTSQQLTVNADGSVNITDNGGSITVDGSLTVTATDLDIRDLDAAQDNIAISDGTDTLAINADGSINVAFTAGAEIKITDGTDDLAINADGSINSVVTATNLDIRDLVFATDKVDVSGSDVTVSNTVSVSATDLDIRDLTHVTDSIKIGDGTDFLAINSDGSINVVPQEDAGTERVNYDTTASVAAGASDNHDFVVTNGGKLYQVLSSASGKLKSEIQIETGSATNTFNTVCVRFNSTANPDCDMTLSKYALVPVGARVRVIRTNRDNQAQDVYSTIVVIEA